MTTPDSPLVLGPLLRYVDQTSAAVWVEVAEPTDVTVTVAHINAATNPPCYVLKAVHAKLAATDNFWYSSTSGKLSSADPADCT